MVLMAPTSMPTWDRWAQSMPNEYDAMDDENYMVFDMPPPNPEYLGRGLMYPPYMISPSYSPIAVQTVPAPVYSIPHNTATTYVPYPSPPQVPATLVTPKQEHQELATSRMTPQRNSFQSALSVNTEDLKRIALHCASPSPSAKSEPQCSPASAPFPPPPPPQAKPTDTAHESRSTEECVQFNTQVDQLMRAIQQSDSTDDQYQIEFDGEKVKLETTPAAFDPFEPIKSCPTKADRPKIFICDVPNCNKRFAQPHQLDIHSRSHTGVRPYVCSYDGCGTSFTQLGNLRTHERRHDGVKPFPCGICGKTFAQKGNVKIHEEIHLKRRPYTCILEGCNRSFSQLGNMKTHQNRFHKDAMAHLMGLVARYGNVEDVPSEYRGLFEYFKNIYKNSNKGIKGRGKDRKVVGRTKRRTPLHVKAYSPVSPAPSSTPEDFKPIQRTPLPVGNNTAGQGHAVSGNVKAPRNPFSRPAHRQTLY